MPGARVRAQHRSPAVPVPAAGRLQGPPDKGAPAPERAEPQVLRAGPRGRLQEGGAGTTHQPKKRYLGAVSLSLFLSPRSLGGLSPQDCPLKVLVGSEGERLGRM